MKKHLHRWMMVWWWGCAWALGSVHAQDFPSKPVTLIVPQNAGGTNDLVGRVVAQRLSALWGVGVVVENRPGAGGNIGTVAAAKAPKDGHTLLLTISSAQAINPALYKNPGFDPVKDFVPLGMVGSVPNVLVVNPSFPARHLDEFLQWIKAHPGQYTYASAGNGTLNHLLGEMLNRMAGLDLQHIPYKGVAPAMNDLMGGQVPMAFASLPSVLGHLKSGRLVALGVSSPERSPSLPEVPAIAEKVKGYSGNLWVALFGPRGMPQAVEKQLQEAMSRIMSQPETRVALAAQGVEVSHSSPQQLTQTLQDDLARWARIVKASGATVD
jgi:tripartite-type tricarboxylate transporter receptor subunit TctC